MLQKEEVEQFYKDVAELGFLRPNAVLAGRMKVQKGNVSAYLNRKVPPSENFIRTFYEVFAAEIGELNKKRELSQQREVSSSEPIHPTNELVLKILDEQKQIGERTNHLLELMAAKFQQQEKSVVSELGEIKSNLAIQGSLLDSVQASILTNSNDVIAKLDALADLIKPSSSPDRSDNKGNGARGSARRKGNGKPLRN